METSILFPIGSRRIFDTISEKGGKELVFKFRNLFSHPQMVTSKLELYHFDVLNSGSLNYIHSALNSIKPSPAVR